MNEFSWKAGYADCSLGQIHYLMSQPHVSGEPIVLLNPRSRSCRALHPYLAPKRTVPQIEAVGIDLYTGVAAMAEIIAAFAENCLGDGTRMQ